jgi:hypothetical protein
VKGRLGGCGVSLHYSTKAQALTAAEKLTASLFIEQARGAVQIIGRILQLLLARCGCCCCTAWEDAGLRIGADISSGTTGASK